MRPIEHHWAVGNQKRLRSRSIVCTNLVYTWTRTLLAWVLYEIATLHLQSTGTPSDSDTKNQPWLHKYALIPWALLVV